MARQRAAAPVVDRVNAPGISEDVPQVQPRLLSLSSSESLIANGPLSGNQLVERGTRINAKPSLSTSLAKGATPLGQWNVGSYTSMQASRPGKEISDHGAHARSSTTLTARIGQGEEPLEVTPGRHIVRPDGGGNAA